MQTILRRSDRAWAASEACVCPQLRLPTSCRSDLNDLDRLRQNNESELAHLHDEILAFGVRLQRIDRHARHGRSSRGRG